VPLRSPGRSTAGGLPAGADFFETVWFSHIAVEIPGTETRNEWLEPVDDTYYGRLHD